MKKIFTSFFFFFLFAAVSAQWSQATFRGEKNKGGPDIKDYYSLDISQLKQQLTKAQEAGKNARPVIIKLPTLDGGIEDFAVYSFPVVVPELATKYNLGSYAGTSLKDPTKYLRFSLAPNDFQSMIIKGNHYEFIEPANKDKTIYGVHAKSKKSDTGFFCSTNESLQAKQGINNLSQNGASFSNQVGDFSKNSDKKYRTMRLVMSVTGEYTQYHGGTVAGALTAINATITRVNGVFEKDFALHLNLQNFPNVIYTNAATDPYSAAAAGAGGAWNGELQNTLTAQVGNANYDIGHLFGASGGGGNAGCIGCVCINPTTAVPDGKGSGYTSPGDGIPQGDNFDIDYVAHEMGHQLGANHTFAHSINGQMAGALIEPGSGSSIMGYAGITGVNTDVQPHSDAYFNRYNINQVQVNLNSKTCDIETAITNNPPVIAALPTYNIPKSTAFVLTASVTDPENDPMTFNWEQQDAATVIINKANLGTTTTGATFRSVAPSTSPTRYFPALATVLAGSVSSPNTWEAASSIARTTKFSITARDNNAIPTQQQTQSADQTIIVGNDGPFRVTTTAAYNTGNTNVTWDVVNTTAAPYSVANVKIDYTKDNGVTWILLTASTPNDGNEALAFTGVNVGDVVKIRVSAIGNVFYAIGSATVNAVVLCTTVPTTINVSAVTQTQANISWAAATGATYNIQYRPVGSATWLTATSATNSLLLTGLTPGTLYEVQVANVCSGTPTSFSASTQFTTQTLTYCPVTSASASSYINNVTVLATNSYTMSNNTGANTYTDYSTNAPTLITLVRGSANNTLSVGRFIASSTYATSAWIDYNGNGIFEASERIMNLGYSSTSPVTATFTVPAAAYPGTGTVKMRVVMSFLTISDPCANVTSSGEIEDYAVRFVDLQPCTTTSPSNVTLTNITATAANVSWISSAGATYTIRYRLGSTGPWIVINPATNPQTITGLTELTSYELQIATICGGTTGAYSASIPFTTPAIAYCPSNSTSVTDGYISNVRVNATNSYVMNSNSGSGNYTDYTNDATRLVTFVRGSVNNTVSVTKEWPGTQYSFGTGVWIDFNRNGVFENSEQVLTSPSNTTSPVLSAGFTVPAGAYNGPLKTRMRVVIRETAAAAACGTFTWGEVEDYAVTFVDMQPCSTAPPANISVSSISTNTATVSWTATTGATYVIRYRTGTGAWTTVTLTAPPVNIYNLAGLLEQTAYEVQVATICGGTTGAFSPSVNFTTTALTYCPAVATSADEFIANVTITGTGVAPMVSNSTLGTAPYYSDYTNDPARLVSLIRGSVNNTISVKRDWPGYVYSNATKAWIDYNRNGIFETSEVILDAPSSTTPIVNATFNVPATGIYMGTLPLRMRVITREFSTPAPCGSFTYGEVEDYSVKLIDLLPCTTAPPTNQSVTNLTATTAYVSWLPAAGATYRVRWRQGTTGAWQPTPLGYIDLPAGQSFYTITGLTEQTAYEVQIMTICNGTAGAFSPSIPFTTTPLTYCPMVGTGTNDYISNVKVTPINFPVMNNTSLQTNYISYTTPATLINLEVGSAGNQISVSKAWQTSSYSDAVYAYIDYNRDGVFADSERIMTSAASTTTPVTATFTVPTTVYTGPLTTTMRVVLKRSSAPAMCADPANGEVEDYAVRLKPCSNVAPSAPTFNTITHTSATVTWTPAANNNSYILQYRPVTNPVSAWTTVNVSAIAGNPPVVLTGLTPATLYEVQIAAVCGGGPGSFTPIRTFTTRCDPTPPNVVISNVTATSAVVTWNPTVVSATYSVRYREVGSTTWTTINNLVPPVNSYTITGLSSYKIYEVQVSNTCVGETTNNPWSNPQVFTTVRVCSVPPPNFTITQLTPTTAEVHWDPFPGATYILRYRKVGIPSWTVVPVNNPTYTITGLLELTKYEMQVVNVCSGTPGNYTDPYFFTTPTVAYCQMSSSNSASEFISKVTAKPDGKPVMTNVSGASNYTDYTGVPAKYIEMVQGTSNNEIIIDKKLGSGVSAGVAVWIDFNRNGYFDLNERIMADGPNANPTASATFAVPADAFVSMTDYKYVVMRVAMQKDGIPVNCLSFQNGEVEDYIVRISKQPAPNSVNQTDILIYPNPVSTILYVKNISKKATYKIYASSGQLVSNGYILNNKIDVSKLINGVYVIDIEDVQGTVQKKFIKE